MTNHAPAALAVREQEHALTHPNPGDFGEEHRRLVREALAPGASEIEFDVLWAGARSRGLDPLRKQVHFVKRWDNAKGGEVWSSQVSIDGFRSIAESTGKYDGQDEPEYEYSADGALVLARVRVWRKDISRPFVGVARWNEYVQTKKNGEPVYMWQKMEHTMLAKCAEALGLRKAFPEPLAGLYSPEEMTQAESEAPPAEWRQVAPKAEPAKPAHVPRDKGPADALAAIKAAATSAEIGALLADIPRDWQKVRAHGWGRLIAFAPDVAALDTVVALLSEDITDGAILGKLMSDANGRAAALRPTENAATAAGLP